MNPALTQLHPYPFERLKALLRDATPPADLDPIALSIGEPQHPAPRQVTETLSQALPDGVTRYAATRGTPALRQAIAKWLERRFCLGSQRINPDTEVLPVNGTREALFAFAQAMVNGGTDALVLMPNPFYQIYEGAALLAGARPGYLNCTAANRFQPDFSAVPAALWQRCQLLYICTPGNPGGAVLDQATLEQLLDLAERYDFVIASDECYSEIYPDDNNPPSGLLQAAQASGRTDFGRCMVFHSLSKRSNLPGLRSGFVAGEQRLIDAFYRYRSYHGCAMPLHVQAASIAAWQDEQHVIANRQAYREKFSLVADCLQGVLDFTLPDAGFYLWPSTPGDDTDFARRLYENCHVTVLPGSFLGRQQDGCNPGAGYVRMALVDSPERCQEAASRIRRFVEQSY